MPNHSTPFRALLKGVLALFCGFVWVSPALCATGHHHARHAQAEAAPAKGASGAPVVLRRQPGSALDAVARTLNADDLAAAARHGEKPLVLIGSASLSSGDANMALFVQVQSASLCGSAGCSTDVYLKRGGHWHKILDSISGPIVLLPTTHGGMKDILVDGSDRWVWKGTTYADTLVAQDLPGLKESIKKHQAAMHRSKHGNSP